jgi:hypothetical protein
VLAVLGGLKGVDQPGYAYPRYHLILFLAASLWTLRLAVRLSRRFVAPPGSGPALGAAFLIQVSLGMALLALGGPDLAFPLLAGAAGLLLAAGLPARPLRIGAVALGALALVPFLSPTSYRMFRELAGVPIPPWIPPLGAMVLVWPWFSVLPAFRVRPEAPPRFDRFRWLGRALGGAVLLLAVGGGFLPAYDEGHRVVVDMSQAVDPEHRSAEVFFHSVESLRGVRLRGLGGEPLPDRREVRRTIAYRGDRMLDIELGPGTPGTGERALRILGRGEQTPRLVVVRLKAEAAFSVLRGESWERRTAYRQVRVPVDSGFRIELPLRIEEGGTLSVEVDAIFDEDLLGLKPEGSFRVIRPVGRIRQAREFGSTDSAGRRVSAIIPSSFPR